MKYIIEIYTSVGESFKSSSVPSLGFNPSHKFEVEGEVNMERTVNWEISQLKSYLNRTQPWPSTGYINVEAEVENSNPYICGSTRWVRVREIKICGNEVFYDRRY